MPSGKDLLKLWEPLEGKSYFYDAIFLANAFIQMASDTWQAECEKWGMEYAVVDAAFDPAKEVEVADLAISRGFDVITMHPTNPAGLSPNVRRAREDAESFLITIPIPLSAPPLSGAGAFSKTGI